MTTDFELGKVPARVFVGRTLDVSEGGLVGGNIAVDIQGYLDYAWPSVSTRGISSGVYTYTSRTRASDANPLLPQS